MNEPLAVDATEIKAAAERIRPYVHKTPLLSSATLNDLVGLQVYSKGEHLQRSGSFKIRGATNRLLQLSDDEKRRGVIAFSSGNHAQGVALAGKLLGIPTSIVMPIDAPSVKKEATRGYGARVIEYDRYTQDREEITREIAAHEGLVVVPPFNDPYVIAGQGTVGQEIVDELPHVDVAIVPVGGGGLCAGIAVALKAHNPKIRIIGVEPDTADDARRSLLGGQIVRIDQPHTIADGVATTAVGTLTFPILQDLVEEIVTVSENEIIDAMRLVLFRMKQMVEPTGALTTAALLSGHIAIAPGSSVVSILCGGNVDPQFVRRLADDASQNSSQDER